MKLLLAICFLALSSHFVAATEIIGETGSNAMHALCKATIGNLAFAMLVSVNPPISDISFILRTPCKNTEYKVEEAAKFKTTPGFSMTKKTAVLIHGWTDNVEMPWIVKMSQAFACRGDYNVLAVNLKNNIGGEYTSSAYRAKLLGEYIAKGLKNLGIPAANIHLIGHSLGAQIAGSAGREYKRLTGSLVDRITGLDIARPCYISPTVFPRLSYTDAAFVDVIHTNPKASGLEEPVGHADFYVEGLDMDKSTCLPFTSCSHHIGNEYFIDSINHGTEPQYLATYCNSKEELETKTCSGPLKTPMGFYANRAKKGGFNIDVPFGTSEVDPATLECGLCPA